MKATGGLAGWTARLLAGTLPQHVRGRYREEWLSDLAGAEELGLSRGSILLGALATSVSMDRDSPVVLGIPASAEAVRRARWAAACLSSAVLLLLWLWMYGGDPFAGHGLEWIGLGVVGIAAVLAVAGSWQVLRALFIGFDAYGAKRVLFVGLLGIVCIVALGFAVIIPLAGMAYGLAGLVTALVLAAGGPAGGRPGEPLRSMRRILLALPFAAGGLLLLAALLLHVFVWNPLAKLPGMTLDEIYAAMRLAGEGPGIITTGVFTALIVLALLVPVVLAGTRVLAGPRAARRIVVLGLLSIAAVSWLEFLLGFGMGMGIADTFGTDGGDAAPAGGLISMIGQFAIVAALFAGLAPVSRDRYRDLPGSRVERTGTAPHDASAGALT
ncbi:hypothetical protein ACFPZL_04235 [Leucobacter soli]|uniref:Uncharacterized protein n=1 Tax=Leucobacter soli TaxID=2812850 RepID=A0A916JZI1_9MICO|nr:hypothetical protein [Leucobacter soli]CAG7609448.1 hypothetical protein LEUCIP111803_01204 [Leucobacter soli]